MTREFTMTAKLQGFMEAQAELMAAPANAVQLGVVNTSVPVIQPPAAK